MLYASRQRQLEVENQLLAPYAIRSDRHGGRKYKEDSHPLRTDFQRDRDRIIHSRAFRRLEYKTQVFLTGANDHFRTRLTHTIEVAGIARTISRSLGLNEDLTETIALGHDLGHPPFGHCGERALNELMQDKGGFDHNQQSLRVVETLEEKYPTYTGINLTWEVRAGLMKHRTVGYCELDGIRLPPILSLEAQTADVADDLAYYGHDLDDGIRAGLIKESDLKRLEIWQRAREWAGIGEPTAPDDRYYGYMIRNLIDMLVSNLVTASSDRIQASGISRSEDACALDRPLVGFNEEFGKMGEELYEFLFNYVYWHPSVAADNQIAVRCMCELYKFCLAHPEKTGRSTRDRIQEDGLDRAIADYIANMTDRYALQQHLLWVQGHAEPE